MLPGATVAIQLLSVFVCGLQKKFSCGLLQSTGNNGVDYHAVIYIGENSYIASPDVQEMKGKVFLMTVAS